MGILKGVILSIEDTLLPQGKYDPALFDEVERLISYFKNRNIEFVVFTNRPWTIGKKPLEPFLKERWGEFNYFCRATDHNVPGKPRKEAIDYVLKKMGWNRTDTLYIGASENDMQTAVNGQLLFLRATWWANKTSYGFEFDRPKDIARFIDTFCLRQHLWCHEIHDGNFEFYALAPFSTMKPEYTLYSKDARAAAKHGKGHPDFWIGALVSSLYFSEIHQKIDYIATYPGHGYGSGNKIMDEAISVFGKCFRKNYIPDLILRHTTATKSQHARNTGQQIGHENQLNTICLNKSPLRTAEARYKVSPLKKGKTVLVLDDICTRGFSLEASRQYIEQTGAKAILVSWLKTINTNFEVVNGIGKFDPYTAQTFQNIQANKVYNYHQHLVNHLAPTELTSQFSGYENWEWPGGI